MSEQEVRETVGFVGTSGRKYGVRYDPHLKHWRCMEVQVVFNEVMSVARDEFFRSSMVCRHAVEVSPEEVGKNVSPTVYSADKYQHYCWPRYLEISDGWEGGGCCLDCLVEKFADSQPLTSLTTTPPSSQNSPES